MMKMKEDNKSKNKRMSESENILQPDRLFSFHFLNSRGMHK